MTLRAAEDHYRRQARLAELVRRRTAQLWQLVPVTDIDAWRPLVPRAASLVAAAQYRAAADAESYIATALDEQGVRVAPQARAAPEAFVGYANDGRPLLTLMDQPRIAALTAVRDGGEATQVLEQAGRQLQTLAVSQVQDAGRQADSVSIITRPAVGWVRMANPPCCERCAVLAGKWFRANTGFLRHPRCDCRHVPAPENAAGDVGTDPAALFASGKVKGLREAERQAIAEGADPAQVINARRRSSGMTTAEGTSRRGIAGKRLQGRARLTPDGIYRQAAGRDEALRLLADNGYIR